MCRKKFWLADQMDMNELWLPQHAQSLKNYLGRFHFRSLGGLNEKKNKSMLGWSAKN